MAKGHVVRGGVRELVLGALAAGAHVGEAERAEDVSVGVARGVVVRRVRRGGDERVLGEEGTVREDDVLEDLAVHGHYLASSPW